MIDPDFSNYVCGPTIAYYAVSNLNGLLTHVPNFPLAWRQSVLQIGQFYDFYFLIHEPADEIVDLFLFAKRCNHDGIHIDLL